MNNRNGERGVLTPRSGMRAGDPGASATGVLPPAGIALQERPSPMLLAALAGLRREGIEFVELPRCNSEPCNWVRQIAGCLKRGDCLAAVLFGEDGGLACCVGNKVPGIRAAAVASVPQAERAVRTLGANLLIVEQAGRTFFEFKQVLRLVSTAGRCPPGVACVLKELDGHAHR